RIARGRGTDCPKARQASVYRFFSRAFIGLPWPMNAAGMTVMVDLPVGRAATIITPQAGERDRSGSARSGDDGGADQPALLTGGTRRSTGESHRAPAPSRAATSPGFDSAHLPSDRQP